MRQGLLATLALFYGLVLGLHWYSVLGRSQPLVEDQVRAALCGKLVRIALYSPQGRPWMLGLARQGLAEAPPEERAMLEQAAGSPQTAAPLWEQVGDSAWGKAAAGFYRNQTPPEVWPPAGFFHDQLELDAGGLERSEMKRRADVDLLLLGGGAALAATNLLGAGLTLLSSPWWLPRLRRRRYAGIQPELSRAWLAFFGIQVVGVVAGSLPLSGASPALRVLLLQSFVYVLGLAWLLPLLQLRPALPDRRSLGLGVAGYWICLPAVFLGSVLTGALLGPSHSVNPMLGLLNAAQGALGLGLVLLAGVGAPIFEEILYRGCLFRALRGRWNAPAAGLFSALVFAAVHADPWEFLPLMALGLVFAWLTEVSGRLAPSMLAHMAWNCGTLLMLALARS